MSERKRVTLSKAFRLLPAMILLFLFAGMMQVTALADSTVIETDVSTPSDGYMFLGLKGKYITDAAAAIDRINEIRLEACQEGVENPSSSGTALTMADYVPIKWSADLEYIARIRAAESALTLGHERTNGESIWSLHSPNDIQSYGEVLAWNWSESMIAGINQWYGEKSDWVNHTGAVTGHYTQMIDPEHLYVGIATFCCDSATYYNTTAGEFTFKSGLNETPMSFSGECIQKLEISTSALSGVYVDGTLEGKKGDTSSLNLLASYKSKGLYLFDTVTWTSSAPSVASVNASGTVTANTCGTATITASTASGFSASQVYTVNHTPAAIPAVAATCTKAGQEGGTRCTVCGKELTAPTVISALGHSYGTWTVTKAATIKEAGQQECSCSRCTVKKTAAIAQLTPVLNLGKTSVKLAKTKSVTVNAAFAAGDQISVKSSNKKIVKASVAGSKVKITALKKAGTATITVTTASGKKATVKVTVKKAKTTKITCKKVSVKKGKKVTLKPVVKPTYSDDKITFKSANKKIATVSKKGVVTGKKKGKTTITVKSGTKSVKVKVTVK